MNTLLSLVSSAHCTAVEHPILVNLSVDNQTSMLFARNSLN